MRLNIELKNFVMAFKEKEEMMFLNIWIGKQKSLYIRKPYKFRRVLNENRYC